MDQQNQLLSELRMELRELRNAIGEFAKFAHVGERMLAQQERLIATAFEKIEEQKDRLNQSDHDLQKYMAVAEASAKAHARWWSVVTSLGMGAALAVGKHFLKID